MVGVWRTWFVPSTVGCKAKLEGHIVVFSLTIDKLEPLELVSDQVNSGLKRPVGGGASHGFLLCKQAYGCVPRVVVNASYILSIFFQGRCREWTTHIRIYKFQRIR
jgi:hypothetical protein